jgi:transposase
LLFETWESTGSVTQACHKAHVSRGLFYYWKPRFERLGYGGLAEYESRAPHRHQYKSEAVMQQVLAMRRQNPDWGKARIAHEMAKANHWVPLVSANTVKRILRDAGLWPQRGGEKKSRRQ